MIISTACTGTGSPELAVQELEQEEKSFSHEIGFACEIDQYARKTYLANFKPRLMLTDMTKESWRGSGYYSDLFIAGIPCQSFSLAGKRLGELDKRGLLFYDFYRYVDTQRPKAFILENVKGLLSDNGGKTFQNWLLLLGDSVNGHQQMFNHADSLGYNLHFTVLNTKDYELPQNRERVFIVGIRSDLPNTFRFPAPKRLQFRLKDFLEKDVDEKYYLKEKMLQYLHLRKANFNQGKINFKDGDVIASCINASSGLDISDNIIIVNDNGEIRKSDIINCIDANYHKGMDNHAQRSHILEFKPEKTDELLLVGNIEGAHEASNRVYDISGNARTIQANGGGHGANTGLYIVPEATVKGFDLAGEGDSVNIAQMNSATRPRRVGKQIANTLDTSCNQAVVINYRIRRLTPRECFRLQGLTDLFFDKSKYESKEYSAEILAKNPKHKGKRIFSGEERIERMSDTQLYKQAGNAISKNVIKATIKNLLYLFNDKV